MRRLVFSVFVLIGAGAGGITVRHDGLGVVLVMMGIGAVVGTVLGGALTGIGTQGRRWHEPGSAQGYSAVSEEREQNYWRDRGHPPFMKPSDAPPDRRMFDHDRQD